jgi:cytochrome c553
MKKLICALAVLALASAAYAGGLVKAHNTGTDTQSFAAAKMQLEAKMLALSAEAGSAANTYVGTSFCMACHEEDAATFYDTQHSMALIRPMSKYTLIEKSGVLANTMNRGVDDFMAGLDFNKVSSVMDPYKPYAPALGVKDGVYIFTINGVDLPVVWVRQQYDRE